MRSAEIIRVLEAWAPPVLQEDYDNSGLQVGDRPPPQVLACREYLRAGWKQALATRERLRGCRVIRNPRASGPLGERHGGRSSR